MLNDPIVALASAPGRAALAVLRLTGEGALRVAKRVVPDLEVEPVRTARLAEFCGPDGQVIDRGLYLTFAAPRSYTGQDLVELTCHGGLLVASQLLAALVAAGARQALPGEFTRRAVLNGKLDLLQAEAIADLIDARMAAGARAAWSQLQGALSGELAALRSRLVEVLADLEVRIDFTDDELPDEDFARRASAIEDVARRVRALLDGFAASRRQREGFRVVFTGRPNAGKSSLMNRLLGSARMIVSDEPGTTRDAVEEAVDVGGVAFVFTDTAGIRGGAGPAETEAVARARERIRDADLRVLVLDGSARPQRDDEELWREVRGADTIVAINKSDLGSACVADWIALVDGEKAAVVTTSARTGDGCGVLAGELTALARSRLDSDVAGISRVRHRSALERALEPLHRARRLALSEDACELAVIEIRSALTELASIGEPLGDEEVLDRIFSEFCIGK